MTDLHPYPRKGATNVSNKYPPLLPHLLSNFLRLVKVIARCLALASCVLRNNCTKATPNKGTFTVPHHTNWVSLQPAWQMFF